MPTAPRKAPLETQGAGRWPAALPAALPVARLFARVALGAAFLSAVADRLGLWGAKGTANVDWGSPAGFLIAFKQLNPWASGAAAPTMAWTVTIVELILGVMLMIGAAKFWTALTAGVLLTVFGVAMAIFLGVKAPFNYSVFSAAGAAYLLAALEQVDEPARQTGVKPKPMPSNVRKPERS